MKQRKVFSFFKFFFFFLRIRLHFLKSPDVIWALERKKKRGNKEICSFNFIVTFHFKKFRNFLLFFKSTILIRFFIISSKISNFTLVIFEKEFFQVRAY